MQSDVMNNEWVIPAGDLCLLQQLFELFSGFLQFTLLLFVLVLQPALHKLIKHLHTHTQVTLMSSSSSSCTWKQFVVVCCVVEPVSSDPRSAVGIEGQTPSYGAPSPRWRMQTPPDRHTSIYSFTFTVRYISEKMPVIVYTVTILFGRFVPEYQHISEI